MLFLQTILGDSVLLLKFADFLYKEQRHELLEFWLRVELFCNISDPKKLCKAATKIYKLHIRTGAVLAVNLDPENKRALGECLNAKIFSANMFQALQNDARIILQFECMLRFCNGMQELLGLVSNVADCPPNGHLYKLPATFSRVLKKYCVVLLKCTPARKRYSMQIMQGIKALSTKSPVPKRSPAKIARQKALDRQKSLERNKSLVRQKSLDRSRSFERQKSLDRQKSLVRQKTLDRQRSFDRQKSFEGQKSLHLQKSLSKQLRRGKSIEGAYVSAGSERYRLSMMLS